MTINAGLHTARSRRVDLATRWWAWGSRSSEIARLRLCLARSEQTASHCAVMLREGDHRIKNSLQIVSSLMSLQADHEENLPSAGEVLRTAAARIQSVARMHDALQLNGGEDSVDLGSVLNKMCESLQVMGGHSRAVAVRATTDSIQAPVAFAQPVVLAVNELVVNALRHAFPGARAGVINVSLLESGGAVSIIVSDNGIGLPTDRGRGKGFGMKLVDMMVSQIGGALRVETGEGTRFTLVAPAPPV